MTGVRQPPKTDKPSRVISRLVTLIVLLAVAGVVIWGTVTDQQIGLVETESLSDVELASPVEVGGLTVNVVEQRGGPIPVVLLHDADVAGGSVFDGVYEGLPARFKGLTVDIPGFGLSERLPEVGSTHTVANLAEVVSDVMEERLSIPAVVVGVGLGGEVAAELAVTHADQVRGLVLVDVDFWKTDTWLERAQRMPFIGRPVTFTFRAGGRFGVDNWAPQCGTGGWCPSADQEAARELATSLRGSTDSLQAFLLTLPSSLVPSALPDIEAPVVYVWSTRGSVPTESVDRVKRALADMTVVESDTWRAHLEEPLVIGEAVGLVSP